MRSFQLWTFGSMAVLCFTGSCIMGCASIHYKAPITTDGKGGEEFSYNRLGLQKLDGFSMTKNEQGVVRVSFTKQEGGEPIMEALNKALETTQTVLNKIP